MLLKSDICLYVIILYRYILYFLKTFLIFQTFFPKQYKTLHSAGNIFKEKKKKNSNNACT